MSVLYTVYIEYITLYKKLNNTKGIYNDYFEKNINSDAFALIELLNMFLSHKITIHDYITDESYKIVIKRLEKIYKTMNTLTKVIKRKEKQIKMFEYITRDLTDVMFKVTGCNVYIKDINISDVSIDELFFCINSMYNVLHVINITPTSYLIELENIDEAEEFAKEYKECSFEFSDISDTRYKTRIEFIESYVVNKVQVLYKGVPSPMKYRNLYTDELMPMDLLHKHCENQRELYNLSDKYIHKDESKQNTYFSKYNDSSK